MFPDTYFMAAIIFEGKFSHWATNDRHERIMLPTREEVIQKMDVVYGDTEYHIVEFKLQRMDGPHIAGKAEQEVPDG